MGQFRGAQVQDEDLPWLPDVVAHRYDPDLWGGRVDDALELMGQESELVIDFIAELFERTELQLEGMEIADLLGEYHPSDSEVPYDEIDPMSWLGYDAVDISAFAVALLERLGLAGEANLVNDHLATRYEAQGRLR